MNKEQEIEHLRKEHQKDLDCITVLSEEIESLREQLKNQKLNELENKKEELQKQIEDEKFKIFMSTPRKPLEEKEEKEETSFKSLDDILLED